MKHVVVGNGVAGVTVAQGIRRADPAAAVHIVGAVLLNDRERVQPMAQLIEQGVDVSPMPMACWTTTLT